MPVNLSALTEEISAGSNVTGVRPVWHTPISLSLSPERLAHILLSVDSGNLFEYLTLAEEMEERDLHYHSVLGTRKMAVSGLKVRVEAAGADAKSKKIADALTELTKDAAFFQLMADMPDALGKGFSVSEIIWDRSGPVWYPAEYKHRDPRFFRFDLDQMEELRLYDQKDMAWGIPLEPYKFVQHRPRIKCGVPIRGGLARLAAFIFMCKGFALKDWMAFAEVYGLPLRLGRYDESASAEQRAALLSAAMNLGTDAAAIIPETMKLEIIEAASANNGAPLFLGLLDWLDSQTSKGVLGQTMSADSKPTGIGSGNASLHGEVRGDILAFDGRQQEASLNRDVAEPFVVLNFGVQDRYPKIILYTEEVEDLKTLADSLSVFIDRGLPVSTKAILEKYGLDEPEEGEQLLKPANSSAPPGASGTAPGADGQRATGLGDGSDNDVANPTDSGVGEHNQSSEEKAKASRNERMRLALAQRVLRGETLTADQRKLLALLSVQHPDEIDALANDAAKDWHAVIGPMLEPILHLASSARDYEEFKRELERAKLPSDKLVEAVALLTFKARGLGDATDKT